MRKSLGVPLYVAAGYCDLGSGYLNLTVIIQGGKEGVLITNHEPIFLQFKNHVFILGYFTYFLCCAENQHHCLFDFREI